MMWIVGPKTTILVMFILVFAGVMFIPISSSDVVDAEFGQWKLGIRAVGIDGSAVSLSIANTIGGQLLSVSSGGTDIESVEFFILAKVIGEGYTTCEINMIDMFVEPTISGGCSFDSENGETVTVDVDGSFTEIFTYTLSAEDIACSSLDDGTHTLKFETSGSVSYKGIPEGETHTITTIPGAETTITIEGPPDDPPEDPPGECTWEYRYEYSSWSDQQCIGDGRMQQTRDRRVYQRYRCTDESSVPVWEFARTETQYRTVLDSSCDEPDPCTPYVDYGDWTNWVYDRCEGSMRYDYRTRVVTTYTCPGPTSEHTTEKEWRHYIDNRVCSLFSIVKISSTFSII